MTETSDKEKTSGLLQRLLLFFLVFIFLLTCGSLLLRYSISERLAVLGSKLKAPPETGRISDILLELNSAENDFQQAILYGYSEKLKEYSGKLNKTFSEAEKILKEYQASNDNLAKGADTQLEASVNGKLELSAAVFLLKKNFDSLLYKTTEAGLFDSVLENKRELSRRSQDTIVNKIVSATKKKNLFKRLQNVFSSESDKELRRDLGEISRKNAVQDSLFRVSQQQFLRNLSQEHTLLTHSQQQLISSNLALINQLRQTIDRIKDSYLKNWEKQQRENLRQYEESVNDLDRFTLTAIIMVLIFVPLLIVYMNRAAKAERQYQAENTRAIALAEQKSELLATMSHEIRNPLTTIAGSVYLLRKTEVNEKQKRMIDAIQTSSDILKETVNDLLDMTKMESQQADILNVISFTPYRTLHETIEAMEFIASRKAITLSFSYEGEQETEVCGDPFRLKQIVLNLVGNAIKFTDEGMVDVRACLQPQNASGQIVLEVSIKDTGIGIDPEKLTRLFTKYYQVDKAHARSGTGLGLYICSQLIKLQQGTIQVQSKKGQGAAFQFYIPYSPISG